MATVIWTLKLYDVGGGAITAPNMNPLGSSTSNTIVHAFNRSASFPLNGIDTLDFSLYLHDPMAYNIKRLRTVVKLWRTVYSNNGSFIYADGASTPCFAGVVAFTRKDGESNTMQIKVQSPFWRLQSRFHILNHYLKTNLDTDEDYTQSELMWKLIDLVNNAFGLDDSNTGIVKGTFSSGNDPVVAPFFVAKGSNTYTNIFETIMNRPGGVDIVPTYYHSDGDPTLMHFNTDEKRGYSTGVQFRYHTGSGDNLDDLVEEESVVPGEFGNYLWAVGAGGPNSGKIAMKENIDDDADGYHNIGIYMRRVDFPEIKRIGLLGPPPTHLKAVAAAEFAQSRLPKPLYECTLSPVGGTYMGSAFHVGDVVSLSASKGALQVSGVTQRIYDITITNSENNIETNAVSLAEDFTDKVAG